MTIDQIKTPRKSEALEILSRHLESAEPLHVTMERTNGEYVVRVIRPSHTALDSPDNGQTDPGQPTARMTTQ